MSHIDFDIDPSVVHFDTLYEAYLSHLQKKSPDLGGLATGAIIFSNNHDALDYASQQHQQRVLLVQRASHDSMPNKWEIPGGAVDAGETLLGGLAREVREESGLRMTKVRGLVRDSGTESETLEDGQLFKTTRGRKVVKFTFVVDVDDASKVKLDPNEHQNYVWATKDECRSKYAIRNNRTGLILQFTTHAQEDTIMKAFAEYSG